MAGDKKYGTCVIQTHFSQRSTTAGILEYWIVKPERRTVEVFVLENGVYQGRHKAQPLHGIFSGQTILPSRIAPDLPVHVEQFFL